MDPTNPTLGENYYGIGTPLAGGYLTTALHSPRKNRWDESELQVAELGRAGSAHPATFNAAHCDGSVRALPYDIEIPVHRRLANRRDGT